MVTSFLTSLLLHHLRTCLVGGSGCRRTRDGKYMTSQAQLAGGSSSRSRHSAPSRSTCTPRSAPPHQPGAVVVPPRAAGPAVQQQLPTQPHTDGRSARAALVLGWPTAAAPGHGWARALPARSAIAPSVSCTYRCDGTLGSETRVLPSLPFGRDF